MAFWGAPQANELHAVQACRTVLRAMHALDTLDAARLERGAIPFRTRFGVHTGFTIVGNVGSQERLNYTALGDNVNLASRLEGVNKYYETRAIISQSTYRYVRHTFICRPLDVVAVKGRSTGVKIYELMAAVGDPDETALQEKAEHYRSAFELYLARDWAGALESFEALARLHENDRPTALLVERCRAYLQNPPGEDWSGIWRIQEK
jgi:adenylate cyclase